MKTNASGDGSSSCKESMEFFALNEVKKSLFVVIVFDALFSINKNSFSKV